MSRIIVTGLDTETTGLDPEKGHSIIEISLQAFDFHTRKKLLAIDQRFALEGKAIDKKAQEVHGISAADLAGKPRFETFIPKITKVLQMSAGVVIHNAEFDVRFLAAQYERAGADMPMNAHVFDTMTEGMFATYDGKSPSLDELCWSLGVDYQPGLAHAADYDVDRMMAAFFAGVDKKYFNADPITQQQKAEAA